MSLSKFVSLFFIRGPLWLALLFLTGAAHAINWNYLDGPFGGQPLALFIDPAGNTWAGMNGSGVYFRPAGAATWTLKPGLPTQSNAHFTTDNAGTVYVSGSSGLYALRAGTTTWLKLSGADGLPDQAAGGLTTDAAGTVFAAMNQTDVYKLPAGQTTWTIAGTGLPVGSWPNNLVFDGAGNLWASIYGMGVYRLAAGTTNWIAVSTGLVQLNVNALAVVGSDVFAGIQFGGVYLLANGAGGNSTWIQWAGGAMSSQDGVYAFAVGPGNMLYAAGDGAVFSVPSTTNDWGKAGSGIELLGPSFSIVHAADGSLTLGNGSGVFVLPPGGSTWQQSMDGLTAGTTYGIVVAPNGDLYAATFGQGVQRLASGTSTWSEVDSTNSFPVVGAIAIDSHGTVFATPGGVVKKLVNGTWTPAGTTQNSIASALAVDASDAVWAGVKGQVRKLAAGATAWVAAGSGLPANRAITALAIDGAGNAYAGIYANGVYVLPAGGATWTLNIAGLDDVTIHVLQRDPAGAIYAGTDSGVYKLVGGTWQKLGSFGLQFVNALAFDAGGNVYAGTDHDYAWRLAAGSTTWTQIGLGLGSRSVYTLTSAGGRIYAGTDASRGSPSGVYALWTGDSVVEFYNTILDNFFVTANAEEQQAIQGGSAGPGWIVTGNAFAASGGSTVCRFYGSLSPGPNSHFYTIDPAECQQLKDIQATTPASEKRWNFESNDFASASPSSGACPATMVSVYRAYNNGFTRGVDSNHRITSNRNAFLQQVAAGWSGEGVVMCAPK